MQAYTQAGERGGVNVCLIETSKPRRRERGTFHPRLLGLLDRKMQVDARRQMHSLTLRSIRPPISNISRKPPNPASNLSSRHSCTLLLVLHYLNKRVAKPELVRIIVLPPA